MAARHNCDCRAELRPSLRVIIDACRLKKPDEPSTISRGYLLSGICLVPPEQFVFVEVYSFFCLLNFYDKSRVAPETC
jgi:hypothetical protein